MKFGMNNFLSGTSSGFTVNMYGVNRMSSTTYVIISSRGQGLSLLTLKYKIQSFFFIVDVLQRNTLYMDFSFSIIKDRNIVRFCPWFIRQKVPHNIVVNLDITDSNGVLFVLMTTNLLEQLINRSGNDTTVLEISVWTIHSESLTSSGLTIAHNSSIVAICDFSYNILGTILINILLRRVMLNFIKFEFPYFLLIVYEAT
jgi:hypothetical protein